MRAERDYMVQPAEEMAEHHNGTVQDGVIASNGLARASLQTERLLENKGITPRKGGGNASDTVGLYLSEIGTVPLLTKDEERELAKIIEKGAQSRKELDSDEHDIAKRRQLEREVQRAARAKDRFIRANLRLVVSVAKRYPLNEGMDLLDLVQEGNLGLGHAVDKFDWRKGFKFSTYATFWIRQAIGRALDNKGYLVRLPAQKGEELRKALRAVSGDPDELDAEHAAWHKLITPASLSAEMGDDGEELGNLLPDDRYNPEDEVMKQNDAERIKDYLDYVNNPTQRYALELRAGLVDGRKHSLREIGTEIGVTGEGARKIIRHALNSIGINVGVIPRGFDNK